MQRFVVVGLGRFGSRLAANLAEAGQEVIAIDTNVRLVEEIRDRVTLAIALDATDQDALLAHGIDKVDVGVVGIGNSFEAIALTTVVLKQIGVPKVVSRAISAASAKILARIGADEVVNPEDESADRWSDRLASPQFLNQFEISPGQSIVELKTPSKWVGKTLAKLKVRAEAGVQVVAIKRLYEEPDGKAARLKLEMPLPDEPLLETDMLLLMGRDGDLANLSREG